MKNKQIHTFSAAIKIIGVNPFIFVPEDILSQLFKQAGKDKGHIPIKGSINGKDYKQTLVKYSGEWRLYINTKILKDSPKRIGEIIEISIEHDTESREIKPPPAFVHALQKNKTAEKVFNNLPASRKLEIVRYLAHLKTEEALERNIRKALLFLSGKERFAGRDKP